MANIFKWIRRGLFTLAAWTFKQIAKRIWRRARRKAAEKVVDVKARIIKND